MLRHEVQDGATRPRELKASVMNLFFGWLWILLGFITGMVLGLFFHGEEWLGGYGSFKRRMYRLGHISFFGLGAVNLLFWLTIRQIQPANPLLNAAAWAFLVGGVTMPACCVIMASFPKAHLIFAVPVISLIFAGAVTVLIAFNCEFNSHPNVLSPGLQQTLDSK